MKKQMKCPVCGQRLYDVVEGTEGQLIIKCLKCKKIIKTDLKKEEIEKVDITSAGERVVCCTCNTRVLDIKGVAKGHIEVKCPRCKEVLSVDLNTKKTRVSLHTEQIGA